MKANHIPRAERLKRRLSGIYAKIERSNSPGPIGDGNPYHFCMECWKDDIAISVSGHWVGCPVPGWEKEAAHYKRLLNEENAR